MKLQRIAAGLAAVVALGSLAACGSDEKSELADDWSGIVEAAKEEGSLVLYTSAGSAPTEVLVKAFTSKYGIKVELVKGTDADLLTKVETEQRIKKGIGDVLITSDANWVRDNPDAVVEHQGPALEDPSYDAATNAPTGKWVGTHAFVPAVSWNTNEIPGGVTDIDDLFDPSLGNGKIGIPDAATSPTIVAFYEHLEQAYGPDFLERLGKQAPRVYATTAAVMQAVVSGEIAASFYTSPMVDEQAAGAPVEWTMPSKSWGVKSSGGTLAGAPHPNAAQLFIDFTLSAEGQEVYTNPKYGTPRSDIPGAAGQFSQITLIEEYPTQNQVDELRKSFKAFIS